MISASAAIFTTGSATRSSLPGSLPVGRRKQKYTRFTRIAVTGLNSAKTARNRTNMPKPPILRSLPFQLSLSPPPPPPNHFLIPPPNPPPPLSSNCARESSLNRDPNPSISARRASSSFFPLATTRAPRTALCLLRIPPPGTAPERDAVARAARPRRAAATVGRTVTRLPTASMLDYLALYWHERGSMRTRQDLQSDAHA
mmetsp:Transcript_5461/g.20597  ORF Transcript_5461/g.20597 Transcript_5461/m.20597 type:complete len:200 (-) Transcript_5461:48-647(-)